VQRFHGRVSDDELLEMIYLADYLFLSLDKINNVFLNVGQ